MGHGKRGDSADTRGHRRNHQRGGKERRASRTLMRQLIRRGCGVAPKRGLSPLGRLEVARKRVPRRGGHAAVTAAEGSVIMAPTIAAGGAVVARLGGLCRLLPAANPSCPLAVMNAGL